MTSPFLEETDDRFEVRDSTIAGAGRGVFARVELPAGAVLEVIGVLVRRETAADVCTHFADHHKFRVGDQLLIPVGFGGLVDTITITAIDRLPLRAAELVAPDGTIAPANSITVDPNPRASVGQFAKSNPWRDAVGGYNALPALALQNAQAGAAMQSQVQLLATLSTADIPLPDPVVYRQDWAKYKIRLSFAAGDQLDVREIPAPAPPPEALGGSS